MFRAISCSSSGGQIVLIQHLVSSLSVSDRPVHRLRKNCKFFLNLCTWELLTDSDNTRCCINTIWPPEDEQYFARNIYVQRNVINILTICASSWSLAKVRFVIYAIPFFRNFFKTLLMVKLAGMQTTWILSLEGHLARAAKVTPASHVLTTHATWQSTYTRNIKC